MVSSARIHSSSVLSDLRWCRNHMPCLAQASPYFHFSPCVFLSFENVLFSKPTGKLLKLLSKISLSISSERFNMVPSLSLLQWSWDTDIEIYLSVFQRHSLQGFVPMTEPWIYELDNITKIWLHFIDSKSWNFSSGNSPSFQMINELD